MIKVLFQIKNNKLFVLEKKRLKQEQKSLINTNVISQNELVFSDEYLLTNEKIVHNFLKELTISYNINTLVIKEMEIAPLILGIVKNIPNLYNLQILEESILTPEFCS